MQSDFNPYLAQFKTICRLRAGFIGRAEQYDERLYDSDKRIIKQYYQELLQDTHLVDKRLLTAKQVHGCHVAVVNSATPTTEITADGLISNDSQCLLGVFVADCAAIYLADKLQRAWGVIHSGAKGTSLQILNRAIEIMQQQFAIASEDLVMLISPAIRIPAYPINFINDIINQAMECGLTSEQIIDCGICTASHVKQYYSYRKEQGNTGRMLAWITS